jgi:holin-like protein
MVYAFALLLFCQLLGESLVLLTGWPLPGPVLGMSILFLWLALRRRSDRELDRTSDALLSHLALLFVPAGVGVAVYLDRLSNAWMPLLLTLVASILITLTVTGWVMQRLLDRQRRQHGDL